jgi:predicted regulator of Ras-like GTPase activity (Roadblock/LC7/MglB family)
MGMQGNLHDMTIADLIQHTCQDQKTAQLQVQHSGHSAILFFKNGNVVHAAMEGQAGEEVVYQILNWEDGNFNLETGVEPTAITIKVGWSALLLEGARRFDEIGHLDDSFQSSNEPQLEVKGMAPKFDDILKEMSGEVTGYIACTLAGMDGINLASHTRSKAVDTEAISAQMTILLKLVDTSVDKLGAGEIEDNLTSTANAYILMRFLPGKQYYLGMVADRKTGNLGNMRLISKTYTERLVKAMPRS